MRYRKRQPSSTLSIKERMQGMTEEMALPKTVQSKLPAKKSATKPKRQTKIVAETKPSSDNTSRPRRRKKSNAKSRAKD